MFAKLGSAHFALTVFKRLKDLLPHDREYAAELLGNQVMDTLARQPLLASVEPSAEAAIGKQLCDCIGMNDDSMSTCHAEACRILQSAMLSTTNNMHG